DPSIFCQVAIALEFDHRPLGIGTEHPVDLSGVESETVETALQFGDVVATQHRPTKKQQTVPQAVSRLVEGAPGVGPDHAIRVQAPAALEVGDGAASAFTELAARIQAGGEPQRGQPVLDVTNGF